MDDIRSQEIFITCVTMPHSSLIKQEVVDITMISTMQFIIIMRRRG